MLSYNQIHINACMLLYFHSTIIKRIWCMDFVVTITFISGVSTESLVLLIRFGIISNTLSCVFINPTDAIMRFLKIRLQKHESSTFPFVNSSIIKQGVLSFQSLYSIGSQSVPQIHSSPLHGLVS